MSTFTLQYFFNQHTVQHKSLLEQSMTSAISVASNQAYGISTDQLTPLIIITA